MTRGRHACHANATSAKHETVPDREPSSGTMSRAVYANQVLQCQGRLPRDDTVSERSKLLDVGESKRRIGHPARRKTHKPLDELRRRTRASVIT